ncbi:MAG: alpha/beta hydrolase [Chloroflexi bacterium]|nr:alpha/beta hydrolase [Chloroflexota bacterium]
MAYCHLECLFRPEQETRSPVVFVHGFPDSPEMWRAYTAPAERERPWLAGRAIYTFAFPNRQTRPEPIPSWRDVRRGVLDDELAAAFTEVITSSPTGQIIPIVHDLGATATWRYARRRRGQVAFEKLVSFSVGAWLRYDLAEHGLRAFTWLYQVIYIAPYTTRLRPLQNLLAFLLTRAAGYQSDSAAEVWRDTYHYWEGWLWPLRLPFYLLGAGWERPFLNFPFPVLFMRSQIDRIATTEAFEVELQRRPDCRCIVLPDVTHWFPEQRPELVLPELRAFLHDE